MSFGLYQAVQVWCFEAGKSEKAAQLFCFSVDKHYICIVASYQRCDKTYLGKRLATFLPMNLDTSSYGLGK